jgi:hypothetical protein
MGNLTSFAGQFGFEAHETLQLPYVFDYRRQCALYLPRVGAIPPPPPNADAPGAARYYQCLADQISALIRLTQGRALVLFASVHEMRAVRERVQVEGLRILVQGEGSVADLAKQFREDVHSVLFGVRSFWTGFDAPGETLVNLILTRIPFEVPTTPVQRARQAWFEAQGLDAFRAWTLPMVKLQMRQGFGTAYPPCRRLGHCRNIRPAHAHESLRARNLAQPPVRHSRVRHALSVSGLAPPSYQYPLTLATKSAKMGYTLIAAVKSEGVHGKETVWRDRSSVRRGRPLRNCARRGRARTVCTR